MITCHQEIYRGPLPPFRPPARLSLCQHAMSGRARIIRNDFYPPTRKNEHRIKGGFGRFRNIRNLPDKYISSDVVTYTQTDLQSIGHVLNHTSREQGKDWTSCEATACILTD